MRAWVVRGIDAYSKLPSPVRWSVAFACAAAVWWSSSRAGTGVPVPLWRGVLHNGGHVVAFGLLALSVELAGSPPAGAGRRWPLPIAPAVATLYGIVDELHQRLVPGRQASVLDVLSDAIGATLFVSVHAWLRAGTGRLAIASILLTVGGVGSAVAATLW